jgi:endonuclease-3
MKFMPTQTLVRMLEILRGEYPKWHAPIVTFVAVSHGSPFEVLVSTVLSLRTKDDCTRGAVERLFAKARTPEGILSLTEPEIEKLIYPVGFYKTKARNLLSISDILLKKYGGKVPDEIDTLLELPGVGRKTANLVVTLGYGKPGICVDTHVHRISNRWGYVETKTPEETEFALRKKLPAEWWIPYNDILVAFGQTICHPTSPWCSKCPVSADCPRIGVARSR